MIDAMEIGFALFPATAAAVALILFHVSRPQPKPMRARVRDARRRLRHDA